MVESVHASNGGDGLSAHTCFSGTQQGGHTAPAGLGGGSGQGDANAGIRIAEKATVHGIPIRQGEVHRGVDEPAAGVGIAQGCEGLQQTFGVVWREGVGTDAGEGIAGRPPGCRVESGELAQQRGDHVRGANPLDFPTRHDAQRMPGGDGYLWGLQLCGPIIEGLHKRCNGALATHFSQTLAQQRPHRRLGFLRDAGQQRSLSARGLSEGEGGLLPHGDVGIFGQTAQRREGCSGAESSESTGSTSTRRGVFVDDVAGQCLGRDALGFELKDDLGIDGIEGQSGRQEEKPGRHGLSCNPDAVAGLWLEIDVIKRLIS